MSQLKAVELPENQLVKGERLVTTRLENCLCVCVCKDQALSSLWPYFSFPFILVLLSNQREAAADNLLPRATYMKMNKLMGVVCFQ